VILDFIAFLKKYNVEYLTANNIFKAFSTQCICWDTSRWYQAFVRYFGKL